MRCHFTATLAVLFLSSFVFAQAPAGLEKLLQGEDPAALAQAVEENGDAVRGAILFHQQYLTCTQCHNAERPIGPDLAKPEEGTGPADIIESLLHPSKKIRKGFETISVLTEDGKVVTGQLVKETPKSIILRDAEQAFAEVEIPLDSIEEKSNKPASLMPAGLANQLTSRQQFLDLAKYLLEIAAGGPNRALELEPNPALYAAPPIPEYEAKIDHAGIIGELNQESYKRGEAIYNRLCINCHGTKEKPGSLPTSLKFASGKFKNGSDPYSMYQTLTRGFGMMVAQSWMVPQQKYDVIHYIREAYLKKHNPSQLAEVDAAYLAGLPVGDTKGPAPSNIEPWVVMDYGPSLINTYEVGENGSNFAYKGIAVRLDPGSGGVSRGSQFMIFDHDTMRLAAAYSGKGFIDYNGIHFNGKHAIHPRIVGDLQVEIPTGPGWADPATGSFDDPRLKGRDDRLYGPLPRKWAQYKGFYQHGPDTLIAYTVGETEILELPRLAAASPASLYTRVMQIGPRKKPLQLHVGGRPDQNAKIESLDLAANGVSAVLFGAGGQSAAAAPSKDLKFDGSSYCEVENSADFDMAGRDFTITARIRTSQGGAIFTKTLPQENWAPEGKTFFVSGGRLHFDIGWVGVVRSNKPVADGNWHDVALAWEAESGKATFYIDGEQSGGGMLRPKEQTEKDFVVRLGYCAADFPRGQSALIGDLENVKFFQRALGAKEIGEPKLDQFVAEWNLGKAEGGTIASSVDKKHQAVVRGAKASRTAARSGDSLLAMVESPDQSVAFTAHPSGRLVLEIPAGHNRFTLAVSVAKVNSQEAALETVASYKLGELPDLDALTNGGPPRWPQELKTEAQIGNNDGPLAVDILTHPLQNPWNCRLRLTGLDYLPGGDTAAVSSWDGSVWLVKGLNEPEKGLTWKRIASGLFQPLGVKYVEGKIYIGCRDQIVILHDKNGDEETDFYECFNNDHQVTDHFHEFAMGLQIDSAGNFYYAKSARHALPALVPHHGTLLKVSKDGKTTEILANGFRAANGVCVNPDGTFFVTDQEGHWNPKNRINWVKPGGFYGNMYGYHDVTDSSEDAMEPPLCWITNSFDRSPAELLWTDSKAWGPLNGSLLNLSYGYGRVYVVAQQELGEKRQGGMTALPIPNFPTGVMRGRFHPANGQLYLCGMFAWAGNASQPGGFYRLRYTGKPIHVPVEFKAAPGKLTYTFTEPLDPESAKNVENYSLTLWDLKRTKSYGSKHYNERKLTINSANLSDDQKTLTLSIPDLTPTWCLSLRYAIQGKGGEPAKGEFHGSIHELGE